MGLDMNLKPLSMTKLNTKVNKIIGTATFGFSDFLFFIVAYLDRCEWKGELHHRGKRLLSLLRGGHFPSNDVVAHSENP